MLGASMFGIVNGVKLQDPSEERRIYSFYNYSWPGNPLVHQLILHRAMMALISYSFSVYSLSQLPSDLAVPFLMLLPYIIGTIAFFTLESERMTAIQFVCISVVYVGTLMLTNPAIFKSSLSTEELQNAVKYLKPHLWPILGALVSSVFGSLAYLATRRIGKNVHPSTKNLYLGAVSFLFALIYITFVKPSYFIPWRDHYTNEQLIYVFSIGVLFWLSQSALSICLENL